MAHFRKITERKLPFKVDHVKINPSMDIIALALSSSDIYINRLYTWQRVSSIPKPKLQDKIIENIQIVDMVWSTDGKILAVAYNQPIEPDKNEDESKNKKYVSSVVLYLIESIQQNVLNNTRYIVHNLEHEVNCLCWQVKSHFQDKNGHSPKAINLDEIKLPLDSVKIPFVDLFICDEELLNLPEPLRNSKTTDSSKHTGKKFSSNLLSFTKFYNSNEFSSYDSLNLLHNKTVNILTVGTKQNFISFYLFGYYKIMTINLNELLNKKLVNDFQLNRIWMASDLNSVQISVRDQSNQSSHLFFFETKLLSSLWKEIFLVNRIRLNIDIRMEFLRDSIKEICTIWSDIVVDIESKLSNYQLVQETSNSCGQKKDGKQNVQLKPQDFIDMLIFGNISMNLELFLHDVSKKETSKICQSFASCVNQIYKSIIAKVLNVSAHILSYLDNLKGMVLNDLQFGNLGILIEDVVEFRREVIAMMDQCNKIMLILNDLKCKMLSFGRLIVKGVFMIHFTSLGEYEINKFFDESPFGRMTIQDFHLVMDFLNDTSLCDGFKFDKAGKMFKNPLSSLVSENDDEQRKNPYKSYLEEKQLKHFIETLANNSQKISKMSPEELFQVFLSEPEQNLKLSNLKENDPHGTREWLQMILKDHPMDQQNYNDLSFSDHFERLSRMNFKTFSNSFKYMTYLQAKLTETSINEVPFGFSSQEKIQKSLFLDCQSVLDYDESLSKKTIGSGYLYVSRISTDFKEDNNHSISIISLIRLRQPFEPERVDSIRFNLVSKCFFECCHCDQVQLCVEDCQFYDEDLMTMIVTEMHSKEQKNLPITESEPNQSNNKRQYLIQCRYRKMFDSYEYIANQAESNFNSSKIDLSGNIGKTFISTKEQQDQSMSIEAEEDETIDRSGGDGENLTIDSLFKLRWLEMNDQQQKCLSVSGNRNLACCRDGSRYRITTFEMDSYEDDQDHEEETDIADIADIASVDDEEKKNTQVAESVEIPK